jgi:hypothetical protein
LFLSGDNQRSRLHVLRVDNIRAINPDMSGAKPVRAAAGDGHGWTIAQLFQHVGMLQGPQAGESGVRFFF